ncbi:MAG TPA: metallophosphoesterase [Patescibacteria group bacterium]|nr:metallophosphoesterase [Patescibacteria group bacterium]
MSKSNIIVCGDIHGCWGPINTLIDTKHPESILQCGDFGWWPKFHNTYEISSDEFVYDMYTRRRKKWDQYGIKNKNTKIYWCDGNHEDHDSLDELVKTNNLEVMPNVFYMPRAYTLELADGRRVLFIGGADSIDKKHRIQGRDWFPQEMISYRDIDRLPDCKIDIVISHTCPEAGMYYLDTLKEQHKDSSRSALTYVLERYNPSLWFFGHFHQYKKFQFKDTVFTALNMCGMHSTWWVYLDK